MKRLRISGLEFRRLMTTLEVPPVFLSSLLNQDLPTEFSSRLNVKIGKRIISSWWYTLPIRVTIPCTDNKKSHALSAAGSNQMNPCQYLHLPGCGMDIRPSKIVMYFHHNTVNHSTSVICMDFQDGRWHEVATEPSTRARESLEIARDSGRAEHPLFMHSIILTSAIRWWQNALECFNDQLIQYVSSLDRTILTIFSMMC